MSAHEVLVPTTVLALAVGIGYLIGSRKRAVPLRRRALLLGDSITQYGYAEKDSALATANGATCGVGWAALLADHYSRKVDVINRGLSGYNTRKAFAILPMLFGEMRGDPTLLFAALFLGANDSAPEDGTPLCSHVPLDEFEKNLQVMLLLLHGKAERVLLIAPPPIDPNGSALRGRSVEMTASYAAAARRAAEAIPGTLFVDTFARVPRGDVGAMLVDGVHLSAAGNRELAEEVIDALEADPLLKSANVAWDLPGWRHLDREQPERTKALVTGEYRKVR